MTVLGSKPPAKVTINEMTTVASVWTHAQFLDGTAIKGHALGLRIAAGNVPNFVDLETGGYGGMIQDPLNSNQTPTMANFATLSSLMAGCIMRVRADACSSLFAAATGPDGKAPTDTLAAAHSIARNAAYKPERVFALLDAFYPVPQGKQLRATPFMPYLSFAPSAWVLPLKFTGGGYTGGAKVMFDSEGNAWSGANFIIGSQGHDALWDGNLSKFAPNGRPLSPITTGFTGGGLQGPGFGTAIDANDRVWINSTSGKTISLFDKNGKGVQDHVGDAGVLERGQVSSVGELEPEREEARNDGGVAVRQPAAVIERLEHVAGVVTDGLGQLEDCGLGWGRGEPGIDRRRRRPGRHQGRALGERPGIENGDRCQRRQEGAAGVRSEAGAQRRRGEARAERGAGPRQ